MNNKHAYLIMAHNEFDILEKQLRLLDDYRNDIYIHIDKKVKNFDFKYYKEIAKKSNIYYVDRIDVRWGDFSQIQCELNLLKQSIKKQYKYYHLISGVDLPLKQNDEIHKFFNSNEGLEFISFSPEEQSIQAMDRVLKYHFTRWNRVRYWRYIGSRTERLLVKLQNIVNFKRKWDKDIKIKKGANWFSITHDLAKHIIEKEDWINKYFKHSLCGDELFLQTIVYNSKFRDRLYINELNDRPDCMMYTDWKRGTPYVFRQEDFQELVNSNKIFARKFSSKVDNEIIINIFNHIVDKKCISTNNK